MFTFTVTPDDGEAFRVTAAARDVVAWEKSTKGRTLNDLQRPAMTDLYALAHTAARRLGRYTGTLKDFEVGVDIEIEDDDEPDPTHTAASAAS